VTTDTEAVVAELAPSQIEALAEGAVVEVAAEGVTVAVGGPESDVSALAPVADTVGGEPDRRIYYPAGEADP
jgi:hypothetical protein